MAGIFSVRDIPVSGDRLSKRFWRARGGRTVIIATEGDERIGQYADHLITVPDVAEQLQPMVTVIPLQMLAYHAAVLRGHDVDKPRNLAKSVTVE